MILITGATGHFGKAAIKFLLEKGVTADKITALVRNEEKALPLKKFGVQIKIGNYDDYTSLINAFKGVEKLLMISGTELDKRDQQHENIVNAAKETSVRHIVYTSFDRKYEKDSPLGLIAKTHIDTENHIKKSGMNYTFMRNTIYTDYIPMFIGQKVLDTGILYPAENGKVPFAERNDMAEAAANILIGGSHINKSYKIVNIENYSFNDIANVLSEISGRKITYSSPSVEVYIETLKNAGVPKDAVTGIVGWANAIREGYLESETSDLDKLLERKPVDLKTALTKLFFNKVKSK